MKRKTLKTLLSLILAAALFGSILPANAQAATKSSQIQTELNALKDDNKAIQSQINAIRRDYDANASEIQVLVNQKNAVDQEIALLNAQIKNLNDQITAYSQLIADAQD